MFKNKFIRTESKFLTLVFQIPPGVRAPEV